MSDGDQEAADRSFQQALERCSRLIELVRRRLEGDKAEDIVFMDVRGRSTIADFVVVASGRSQRHVGALADLLVRELKDAGEAEPRVEGFPQCDWVLVDAGPLVIHLFRPEVRSFYNIEKVWRSDGSIPAQILPVPERSALPKSGVKTIPRDGSLDHAIKATTLLHGKTTDSLSVKALYGQAILECFERFDENSSGPYFGGADSAALKALRERYST